MKKLKIHQVDAFTTKLFGGNPTAVVRDAHVLSDDEMRQIALEMNLSESVFLLPSAECDVKMRFFTPPGDEIKFCGHATVGALYTIATQELYGAGPVGRCQLTVETNAGPLIADIDFAVGGGPSLTIDCPTIDLVAAPYELEAVAAALGLRREQGDWDKPLMLERTNGYLYLASPGLQALGGVELDVRGAIEFAEKDRIVVFCVIAGEAFAVGNHVHARGFAPLVGVPEDPFTGSMQGGLAAYVHHNGMIEPDVRMIGSEQGNFIGRPGNVRIEVTATGPEFTARMHASAHPVFETELTLP